MKSAHTQSGKGLITFLAGSVAALVAIAAMLLMLNSNSEKTFKQPELANARPSKPEVLSPGLSSQPQPSVAPPRAEPAAVEPVPTPTETVNRQDAPPAAVPPKAEDKPVTAEKEPAAVAASKPAQAAKPVPPREAESVDSREPKRAEDKPARPTTAKTDTPPELTEAELKPTAQQILDSGNIEKARETARREALAKRAAADEAAKAQAQNHNKAAAKPAETAAKTTKPAKPAATPARTDAAAKKGSASVQAGAFGNREAAEAQRAKLALMGVQTQVVAVESQGKKVYRVQTGKLSADKAREVQQNLKDQGVNSYTKQQ